MTGDPISTPRVQTTQSKLTSVGAGEVVARGGAVGQDVAVRVLDVNDGTAVRGNGASGARGGGIGEGDRAEVGEGNEAGTRLKVLDDPLRVGLAEGGGRAAEGVGDLLAGGQVLEGGNARGLGGGVHLHVDRVTLADGEVGERVRVVGDPLVPGVVGAVTVEGDTGLQDGGAASVAVDADPGGSSGGAATGGPGGDDGALDLVEALADLDGAGPVGGVLRVGVVPHVGGRDVLGVGDIPGGTPRSSGNASEGSDDG